MEGLDLFRPIQCYSCFQWCQHYRNECPTKHEPQICSRCTETDHLYTECINPPKCLNCEGEHSVTARICPEYTKVIEMHKPTIAKQLAHYILNTLGTHTQSDNTISTDILRTAILEASNKEEFLTSLFENCKQIVLMESNKDIDNSVQHSNECDMNVSHNTLPDPEDISTHDAHTEDDNSLHQYNHSNVTEQIQLQRDTPQNAQANTQIPSENSQVTPQSFTPTTFVQTYQDCQYGLTNCGIKAIDKSVRYNAGNFTSCLFTNPHNDTGAPQYTQLFFKTIPDHNQYIKFLTEHSQILLKPETISEIDTGINYSHVLFNVNHGPRYKIEIYDKGLIDRATISHLSHWIEYHYFIPVVNNDL